MKIIGGKQVPETGDLWEDIYRKSNCVILQKEGYYTLYLTYSKCVSGKEYFTETCFDNDYFLSRHKYLGKSKANIKELFEVQNAKD